MSQALRVRDHMTSDLIVLSQDLDVMRAIHRLIEADVSGAPVVDDDGALVGIVTQRDCLEIALHAGYFGTPGGKLGGYMVTDVETVTPDLGIVELAKRLVVTPFRRFPVVEEGSLVGMITRRDVLHALFSS